MATGCGRLLEQFVDPTFLYYGPATTDKILVLTQIKVRTMKYSLMAALMFSTLAAVPLAAQTVVPGAAQVTPVTDGLTLRTSPPTSEELAGAMLLDVEGKTIGRIEEFIPPQSAAAGTTSKAARERDAQATPRPARRSQSGDSFANDSNTPTASSDRAAPGTNDVGAQGAEGTENADEMLRTQGGERPTHVLVDVGGYLRGAARRVAIPVEDLVVHAKDSELRIHLPWTAEALRALPAYDETKP